MTVPLMRRRPVADALTDLLPNQIAAWVLATLGLEPQERAQAHRHVLRRMLPSGVPRHGRDLPRHCHCTLTTTYHWRTTVT